MHRPLDPPHHTFFFLITPPPPTSTLFPYTTLFRSLAVYHFVLNDRDAELTAFEVISAELPTLDEKKLNEDHLERCQLGRSEEHTSELQSHSDLVCRLLLEKKKKKNKRGKLQCTNCQ